MLTEVNEEQFVLPGNDISDFIQSKCGHKKQVVIGPGLRKQGDHILSTKAGRLCFERNPDRIWIDSKQNKYHPTKGDRVVGTVLNNRGNQIKVDIGTSEYAMLNVLAFEGATKRNRPDIKIGDLVYGQLLVAGRNTESEMVCINSKGKRDGMGLLPAGGFMFTVSAHVSRILLNPNNKLLENLGSKFKFELAVGLNGNIWIKGTSASSTIYLINAIKQVEMLNEEELKKHCDNVLETFVMVK